MFRAAILLVVVATIVGALMPAHRPVPDKAAVTSPGPLLAPAAATASAPKEMAAQVSGGEVSLTRRSDGHFYAIVEINGVPIEFLVDTGATAIAMTEADARRASVPLGGERRYVGEGAGGALQGEFVQLGRVQLGDQLATGMTAVVIDGATSNLLGQTFLTRFSEVSVRGDIMTLR